MADTEPAPKKLIGRVEDELRADAAADEKLGQELIAELVQKVEALEKRLARLERQG